MMVVPEMRGKWHKLWSMRFIVVTTFLSSAMVAFSGMPPEWQATIPTWLIRLCAVLTFTTAGLAGISRLISQPKLHEAVERERKEKEVC